jgi:hypothetical protein
MLAILPLIAFFALWLFLGNYDRDLSWRQLALRTGILWGTFAILSAELLSLINYLKPFGLSLSWGSLILVAVSALRRQQIENGSIRLPRIKFPQSWVDRTLLAGVFAIILITGVLGLLSPPQSVDSLHYHMSRIAHWAQEGSIGHFATGIRVQNSISPGAEILMLHPYVLSQSDFLVNSVQWIAMFLSLLGVTHITQQLGGSRKAELLSAIFVVSLPMGIAQASNTLNDYVAAFWLICVTVEGLNLYQSRNESDWRIALVFLSLATGLVILTKATALPYLTFSGFIVIISVLKRGGRRDTLRWVVLGFILIAVVISGYLIRNAITYANIFDKELVDLHRNELISFRGILSNIVKNAGLHAGTPWEGVNNQIYRLISAIHVKIDLDINDPRTTLIGYFAVNKPTTNEAYTGNYLHAYLVLTSFFLVIFQRKSIGNLALYFGAAVIGGFFLFSAIYKWQIVGSRYHLPFFVMISSFVACLVCSFQYQYSSRVIGFMLLLSTVPWLFGIRSRPIIPSVSNSPIESVLTNPRESFYTVNVPWVVDQYHTIIDEVIAAQCSRVGLMLGGSAMEYLLWAQLGAPRNDLEIEWIVNGTPSERYVQDAFSPCAVICEKCPQDMIVVRGLPVSLEQGDLRLYASDTEH